WWSRPCASSGRIGDLTPRPSPAGRGAPERWLARHENSFSNPRPSSRGRGALGCRVKWPFSRASWVVRTELRDRIVGKPGVDNSRDVARPRDIAVGHEPILGGGDGAAVHTRVWISSRPRHEVVQRTILEGRVLL